VLAKPNVISDAAGRKSAHNHAQTARNLGRSLRNAAAGARLIQVEGLDSKSAAEVAASLADALEELHRLQRAFSIDVFDATNDAGPPPANLLDLDRRCRGGLSTFARPNSGHIRWRDCYRPYSEVRSRSCLGSAASRSTLASSRWTVACRSSACSFSAATVSTNQDARVR
jgi:hypothetical protein